MPKAIPFQEGQRFGRWVVIAQAGLKGPHQAWECRCDCGTIRVVAATSLVLGKSKSCGCYRLSRVTIHGDSDMRGATPWQMWMGMWNRVRLPPTAKKYKYYGARDVYVVDEWLTYEPFRDWAYSHGFQPGLSLDRLDPAGPYAPWNCQIVTVAVNSGRAVHVRR